MQANAFAAKYSARRMCALSLSKGIIGLILVGLFASQALAVANITGVNVVNKPDCVVLSVQGSAPLKMSVLTSSAGNYLGFQFPGPLQVKGRLVGIHSGRIFNVRYSRFQDNPPVTRLVLNTACHLDYSTQWNDDKTRVDITVWKFGASRPVVGKSTSAAATELTASPVIESLPVLPPAEISGPQGSEPGQPADPAPVKARVQPMRIARVAPPRPVRVAQATSAPATSRIELDFLDADINDVLKALSVQSGKNIVSSKDVKGNITVSLSDVTVEQALDYVSKISGYSYVVEGDTYLVGSKDSLKQLGNGDVAQNDMEFITLPYTNAVDVKNLLAIRCPQLQVSLLTRKGQDSEAKIVTTTRKSLYGETSWMSELPPSSDMLVLTGSRALINEAKAIIAQIDDSMRTQKEDARKWIDDKRRDYYKVKYANPGQLADTLTALVPSVAVGFRPCQ